MKTKFLLSLIIFIACSKKMSGTSLNIGYDYYIQYKGNIAFDRNEKIREKLLIGGLMQEIFLPKFSEMNIKIAPIMRRRFDLAVERGFDGIHPDNIDAFENETGFNITYQDQLRYNLWLSQEAHKRNLIIAQKNAPSMAKDLYKYYDSAILENCFLEGWCDTFVNYYINNSKPVFAIEYFENNPNIQAICQYSKSSKIYFILKKLDLGPETETYSTFNILNLVGRLEYALGKKQEKDIW